MICNFFRFSESSRGSQEKIGYGCGNTYSFSPTNLGASDNMPYHTGTRKSSRTYYGDGTQYRWIEDLWGNVCDWVDGIYFIFDDIYAIKNPANFSDNNGGTWVGTRPTSSAVVIKAWKDSTVSGYEWFVFPSEGYSDNNYATYCCDIMYYYRLGEVLYFGGSPSSIQSLGLFYVNGVRNSLYSTETIGTRLLYLP